MASITIRTVANASPRDRRYIVWDDELTGFGVRISPSGLRSFRVQYRTTRRAALALPRVRRLPRPLRVNAALNIEVKGLRLLHQAISRNERHPEDTGRCARLWRRGGTALGARSRCRVSANRPGGVRWVRNAPHRRHGGIPNPPSSRNRHGKGNKV